MSTEVDKTRLLFDDMADGLGWLLQDLGECYDKERNAYVIYHYDCMSGTSCDACRIIGRIDELRKQALLETERVQ